MPYSYFFLDELDSELSGDYGAGDGGFTLESILAEFKGGASPDSERGAPGKAPPAKTELPEPRTARRFDTEPVPAPPAPEREEITRAGEDGEPRGIHGRSGRRRRVREERDCEPEPESNKPKEESETVKPQPHAFPSRNMEAPPEPAYETAPEIDLSVFDEPDEPQDAATGSADDFFASLLRDEPLSVPEETRRPPDPPKGETPRTLEDTIVFGGAEEEKDRRRQGFLGRFFSGGRDGGADYGDGRDGGYEDDAGVGEDEDGFPEDDGYIDLGPEPDFKAEAQRYGAMVPSLRFRIMGAAVLSAVAVIFTILFTRGSAPFGVERAFTAVGTVVILELLVMALGIDVLIRGLEDILSLSPGAESLVFISCAMSVCDGFVMLLTGNFTRGLPLAAVSCVSLLGAMSARKSVYMALCDSLKAAVSSGSYYGVTADHEGMEERGILKKVASERTGFYAKLASPDAGERLYDNLAPLLVIVSFVLTFTATVGHGAPAAFTHSFSILTAACAAFPATAVFALPFKYAASRLRKAGAALAGYAGASDIFDSDGAIITDQDIFPVGSVSLSGVKVFENTDPRRVIVDTASLIIASDSGLRKIFEELLKNQGLNRARIDDFACYDGGGIGGVVAGQRVLVGTGAFMNLMGLRVPENVNTTSSVFTAINDELAGVFALEYVPSNSVQSALVALLGTDTNLLMAVRDFNVTPNTVKQKFKVSMDGVEYLPVETAYGLSQDTVDPNAGVSAVLVRGGLAPFAEVITRGRLLKLITQLNTCVTVVGTVLSVIILFFLCWTGSFASASAMNVFLFMAVIGAAVYIMSQATRKKMK